MNKTVLFFLAPFYAAKSTVGGQAVIEGVMMRGKEKIALSVRRKAGNIQSLVNPHIAYKERMPLLKIPILRGAATFIESLVIGMRYLSISADFAMEDEKGVQTTKSWKDSFYLGLSIAIAFVAGMGVFFALPYFITGVVPYTKESNPVLFNLTAGFIRIVFFLAYVWGISFMKDVKRLFQYHGAEHKSIFCFEAGQELTQENITGFSTHHPRCGTSFLLIAAVSCILVFAVIDALIALHWAAYVHPPWHLRLAVHLPLIPLVSGISFEFLKLSDRFSANPVVGALSLPGLLLQNITTEEPDASQIEVAVAALKNAV